ncbi:terminase small subunit-like protein [Roseomonas marmotae]|uniref:Terminase small subunit n=1 Tax=Roseomonas marmotae TaxID=2768161 RepID=A0ABS3KII9_9PROT|nr:hypothetical protein [Roseomonas marmotae]MBO1077272.1 hypothetical protein [Roseomonas marmotae]QTI81062.1 hypothetical protein IAI58_16925 [Roseomonas marmotae]
MSKRPARLGRPSSYTPELAASICARMADGQTLTAICREDGMPDRATVFRWTETYPNFCSAYARAREAQAHALAELALLEAMRAGADLDPAAARVRFDAARWLAGKVAPRFYGNRADQTQQVAAENSLVLLLSQIGQRSAMPVANFGNPAIEVPEEK